YDDRNGTHGDSGPVGLANQYVAVAPLGPVGSESRGSLVGCDISHTAIMMSPAADSAHPDKKINYFRLFGSGSARCTGAVGFTVDVFTLVSWDVSGIGPFAAVMAADGSDWESASSTTTRVLYS